MFTQHCSSPSQNNRRTDTDTCSSLLAMILSANEHLIPEFDILCKLILHCCLSNVDFLLQSAKDGWKDLLTFVQGATVQYCSLVTRGFYDRD